MTQEQDEAGGPAGGGRVVRSAMSAVALTWTMRLIGLVSVFVLARLLTPSDFGIMAIALAVVAIVDIFSALGLRQALLRIAKPDRSHLDTAWTIQMILMNVLGMVVAACGPLVAGFFGQPELSAILGTLSLTFIFYGMTNIGIVDFDRNLDFGRDLRMRLTVRLTALVGTVAAAVLLQSYWALVTGLLLQSALHAAASYLFHPFRPRFSLSRRSELLDVSLWMFLSYAAQVVQHQSERLIVGRFAPLPLVGLYSVGKDLSSIFTLEIATALNRVTFVTTARRQAPLSEDPGRAAAMLGAYAAIAAPMGIGLAAVADDLVLVLFGSGWAGAAPLLQLIAPASALYAITKLVVSSLQASGLARRAAGLSGFLSLGTLAGLLAVGIATRDAYAIALAALALNLVGMGIAALVFARTAGTGFAGMAWGVVRPLAAGAAMFAAVRWLGPETGLAAVDLILSVVIGASVYAGALGALWRASGRPDGFERQALTMMAGTRAGRMFGRKAGAPV